MLHIGELSNLERSKSPYSPSGYSRNRFFTLHRIIFIRIQKEVIKRSKITTDKISKNPEKGQEEIIKG